MKPLHIVLVLIAIVAAVFFFQQKKQATIKPVAPGGPVNQAPEEEPNFFDQMY